MVTYFCIYWVIKQLFHAFYRPKSDISHLGAVDDPMQYRPRFADSCHSASGRQQHLGAIDLTIAHKGIK